MSDEDRKRIEKEAEKYSAEWRAPQDSWAKADYIAGATAEHERLMAVIEDLKTRSFSKPGEIILCNR